MSIDESIGGRMKYLMEKNNHNVNSLSILMGVSYNGLNKAIINSNPTYKTIMSFVSVFPNVSFDWLMRGDGEPLLTDKQQTMTKTVPEAANIQVQLNEMKAQIEKLSSLFEEMLKEQRDLKARVAKLEEKK